jgi:RNA polymerase sigma-70 factor (ECF subfamily)
MEPIASPPTMAAAMELPYEGIQDFEEVVRLYWPRVFRFALASLRDGDAAQTLAQDCFLRAYRGRAWFRGESSVATWLMRIEVNLVRDAARKRGLRFWRQARASSVDVGDAGNWLPDRGVSPEARASLQEEVRAVWKSADRLPAKQKTVFLLRFVEEMSILEIAAATGMKEATVKTHLFRALAAVRERLGKSV